MTDDLDADYARSVYDAYAEAERATTTRRDALCRAMHQLMATRSAEWLATVTGMTPYQVRHWDRKHHEAHGTDAKHYKTGERQPVGHTASSAPTT